MSDVEGATDVADRDTHGADARDDTSISESAQDDLNGGGQVEAETEAELDPQSEPTDAERAASQARIEAEGRTTRDAFETRNGHGTGIDGPGIETGPTLELAQAAPADVDLEVEPLTDVVTPVSPVVGNTPGADFVLGAPLTEATQTEILADAQADFEAAAVGLAELDALVEAEVFAAQEAFVPSFETVPGVLPGFTERVQTQFDAAAARRAAEAAVANERRAIEYQAQNALNMAHLVGGVDGVAQLNNGAIMALEGAGFGRADIQALGAEGGALSPEAVQRAEAFTDAANAWGSGGSADPAHRAAQTPYGRSPDLATTELVDHPGFQNNPHLAANLDGIVADLEAQGQPELAAEMRLYAVTQLGDALYAGRTGDHAGVLSVVSGGEPITDLARVVQGELASHPAGQAALRQFQALIDPTQLDQMDLETGAHVDVPGLLSPQRPSTAEIPFDGYPDVIRETLGEHISDAMDYRGTMAAVGLASLFVPGPEDVAIGAAIAGWGLRGARVADDVLEAAAGTGGRVADDIVADPLAQFTRHMDDVPTPDAPRTGGVIAERQQAALAGRADAEILGNYRGPSGKVDHFVVRSGDQTWHIPPGRSLDDVPATDPVGDRIQGFADDAAARWDPSINLTENEMAAIARAHDEGKHYLANILEQQARGRWVETEIRELMTEAGIANRRPGQGLDFIDTETGLQYDFMSGTASNIDRHARREGEELFRMITF